MTRRWTIWTLALFGLALVLAFPLRLAVGGLPAGGLTARQVAGTIWYGRLGEVYLQRQRLGTFEVELDPLALLLGGIDMRFNRLDDPDGVLAGTLVLGSRRGLRETTGRINVAGLFGSLPIDALQADRLSLVFRGQECATASGGLTAIVSPALAPLFGTGSLSGGPRCEDGRVRLTMRTPDGGGKVEVLIRPGGQYRGWMTIRDTPVEVMTALTMAGFRPSPDGMMLSVDGQL